MANTFSKINDRILDSITEGDFTVDQKMKINFFNRSAEKITGVSKEQALGMRCHEVFRADICQAACALKQSIETGTDVVNRKVNIINNMGQTVPININTTVLKDDKGGIIGGVETFRDISAIEPYVRRY